MLSPLTAPHLALGFVPEPAGLHFGVPALTVPTRPAPILSVLPQYAVISSPCIAIPSAMLFTFTREYMLCRYISKQDSAKPCSPGKALVSISPFPCCDHAHLHIIPDCIINAYPCLNSTAQRPLVCTSHFLLGISELM